MHVPSGLTGNAVGEERLLRIKAEYDSTSVFKGIVYASLRQNLAVFFLPPT